MIRMTLSIVGFFLTGCATMQGGSPTVSTLVDLDPASAERTVIVESITADKDGRLYLPERVTGNILRVDPKSPKPVVVGKIEARQIGGKSVRADASGVAFSPQGDLFVAVGPFREIVRIRKENLNPQKPGSAETFATGAEGANGIVFDKQGNLYISGGRTGRIYRVGPDGGVVAMAAQIEPHVRKLPDGKTQQPIVANGLEIDGKGVLHVADTARGAIWTIELRSDGKGGKPAILAQSPLLEGADGLAFDGDGTLWITSNERNALLRVTPDGKVREVAKNDSKGPLEFPSAIVFAGKTAYISNFDNPRRDNMDSNGKTALDGIGASIAQMTP
jgi:sugar lactone lactonase YvrE